MFYVSGTIVDDNDKNLGNMVIFYLINCNNNGLNCEDLTLLF